MIRNNAIADIQICILDIRVDRMIKRGLLTTHNYILDIHNSISPSRNYSLIGV